MKFASLETTSTKVYYPITRIWVSPNMVRAHIFRLGNAYRSFSPGLYWVRIHMWCLLISQVLRMGRWMKVRYSKNIWLLVFHDIFPSSAICFNCKNEKDMRCNHITTHHHFNWNTSHLRSANNSTLCCIIKCNCVWHISMLVSHEFSSPILNIAFANY